MKYLYLVLFVLLTIANIACGALLSSYSWTNVFASTAIVLLGCLLLSGMDYLNLKTAFKISLTVIFLFLMVIEFILAIMLPETLEDNNYIVALIVIWLIKLLFVGACSVISKIDK